MILRLAMTAALLVVLAALGAPTAQAAAPGTPCSLSLRDQAPPGGTPAYNLTVAEHNTACATAVKVMKAFHRCRTESGVRCNRRVQWTWRCSGRRDHATPTFHGSFTCTSGAKRVTGAYHQDTPACFGAAARDPRRPCVNPTRSVRRIDDRGWECKQDEVAGACTFGYRGAAPRAHFAVVGDSHEFHWRSPLNIVAQIERWRGYSISKQSCYFSEAETLGRRLAGCEDWYRTTQAWLAAHPEVSTLFVTHNADTPVRLEPGETSLGVKVDGFRRAWEQLPPTITHVVVLRDLTRSTQETLDCVKRVTKTATRRLSTVCPLARSVALRTDTAVEAVRQIGQPRYTYIDLSNFLCAPSTCFPVVGGTQVNGDVQGHIDTAFMRTLGPYLLREVRRLMASW